MRPNGRRQKPGAVAQYILQKGRYAGGREAGVFITFRRNGRTMNELWWKDEKLEGIGKHYFKNSVLEQEGRYKDAKFEGTWKVHSADGALIKTLQYDEGIY